MGEEGGGEDQGVREGNGDIGRGQENQGSGRVWDGLCAAQLVGKGFLRRSYEPLAFTIFCVILNTGYIGAISTENNLTTCVHLPLAKTNNVKQGMVAP